MSGDFNETYKILKGLDMIAVGLMFPGVCRTRDYKVIVRGWTFRPC